MRARLPWILFFVSLALNVSVIAGVLWVGHHKLFGPRPGPEFIQHVSEELKLAPPQHDALAALRDEILAKRAQVEATSGRWTDTTVAALSEAVYDPETVRWASIERSQPMRDFFIWMTGRLHDFVWTLDDKQRQAFIAHVGEDRDFLRNLFQPASR